MAANILQEYLVSLGWSVDNSSLRKFDNALKHMSDQVQRYTAHPLYGIAPMFVKAGASIVGVLASITASTVGLLSHTAQADLDFQILARRMFMSADAAKHMKIATDALGYSLEDIIWGPAELGRRYKTLIEDQRAMSANLGGVDFETQMMRIRDVEFEFTRFKVELQYFGMQLAGTVAKAIFGDHGDLLQNLQYMNQWFQDHIPEIADKVSHVLVPALQLTYHILEDIWKVIQFIGNNPLAMKLLGYGAAGAAAGSVVPGVGTFAGAWAGLATGGIDEMVQRSVPENQKYKGLNKNQMKFMAGKAAQLYGIDPAMFQRLIELESAHTWDPNVRNPTSGAFGLTQFMPNGAATRKYGVEPGDSYSQIYGGAHYLSDLIKQYGVDKALKIYGGFSSTDPSAYINTIKNGAPYHPTSFQSGGGGGGSSIHVSVNVSGTNATPDEIANAAVAKIREAQKFDNQRMLTQFGGVSA